MSEMTMSLKTSTHLKFYSYQDSEMGTLEFHSLDLIVKDIRAVSDMKYMYSGVFEQAHNCS